MGLGGFQISENTKLEEYGGDGEVDEHNQNALYEILKELTTTTTKTQNIYNSFVSFTNDYHHFFFCDARDGTQSLVHVDKHSTIKLYLQPYHSLVFLKRKLCYKCRWAEVLII